MYKDFNFVPEM